MLKKTAILVPLLAAISYSAHATIVFNVQADRINTAGGVPIPQSSLILLIGSTLDGAFGTVLPGSLTAPGSSLNGDDRVLFRTNAASYGVNGVVDFSTGPLVLATVPNWTPGDPLALLWFPTLTSASLTIPEGTPYGFYSRGTAVNLTQPWITPPDPTSAYPLGLFTTNGTELSPGPTAANPPSAGNASLVATPEPTSAALLALGLVSLAARRRRVA